jgi:hypothetical protein
VTLLVRLRPNGPYLLLLLIAAAMVGYGLARAGLLGTVIAVCGAVWLVLSRLTRLTPTRLARTSAGAADCLVSSARWPGRCCSRGSYMAQQTGFAAGRGENQVRLGRRFELLRARSAEEMTYLILLRDRRHPQDWLTPDS